MRPSIACETRAAFDRRSGELRLIRCGVVGTMVGCAWLLAGCMSNTSTSPTTTSVRQIASATTVPSTGPPLLMTTSCTVGTYAFPTEDGNGPNQSFAGEQVTLADHWIGKRVVEVSSLVVVFYDGTKEVGSINASANGTQGSPSGASAYENALSPAPVHLTYQQSQTWTLPAGWTGTATNCTVVGLTSSPQVPQDQVGQSN